MKKYRTESDSLGEIKVPADCLWGAQTQRSLEHFNIGRDLMPPEMIQAYAILKKASALTNYQQKRLPKSKVDLIVKVCDEILAGKHDSQFLLHVWMSGSGTQFNMNFNEVIANRCSQLSKKPLGSKIPVHPNDDVNLSQSSNDTFPAAMNISAAMDVNNKLLPTLKALCKSIAEKAKEWKSIVKLGRTHLQDATPLTLGQEFSGYAATLQDNIVYIQKSLQNVYELPLGGTAIGTGINTIEGFDKAVAQQIAKLTKLPFTTAKNKFAAQGSHSAMVELSGALRNLAVSLYKIANDIRLLSCGPRGGFYELLIPNNEPGSSIMPGKINPTQCEALSMVAVQVMANDMAVAFGNAGGYLEMNVYKPLIIYNLLHSINILNDCCHNFDKFLIQGLQPNLKKIKSHLDKSLMHVTALTPKIGYDKASEIAHYALEHDLSLKEAALKLGYVTAEEFDKHINLLEMCHPTKKGH